MGIIEDTHDGKNIWGLVFYGVKYKLFDCYRLGLKYPTASLALDSFGKLITDHRILRILITDSDGILGFGKKCKQVLGRTIIPLYLSETDKHNKTPVERSIHNLKDRCSKIRNACGTGVLAYDCETMEYLCDVNNYVVRSSFNNNLIYEAFWGETPDISMIRFK